MIALWHSAIMAAFLMQQTISVLIIHSSYFLRFLVELEEYIASRTAINSSLFVIYSNFLSAGLSALVLYSGL